MGWQLLSPPGFSANCSATNGRAHKPRIHLFGGYTKDFKTLVETTFGNSASPSPGNATLSKTQLDRNLVLLKLQDLWVAGWKEELEELCRLRNDWGFQVTADGVVEK
jgi:hypothetical protein